MKFSYTVCFFFSTVILWGQEKQVSEFPMEKSSLLWEISRDDLPGTSYLFGTMHLIEKDYFIFPKKLQRRIKNSEILVMELAEVPEYKDLIGHLILPTGSLFDLFTEQQTDSIFQWAKDKFQIDEGDFRTGFSKLKPFAIMQMAIQLQFAGKTESYELSFQNVAKKHNIEINGLETVNEQMALFDNLSNVHQVEMLMETIREGDETINRIRELQELYVQQNIDSLFLFITEDRSVLSENQNEFIDSRNEKWIPKIVTYISNNNTFIAVGAGHLGGVNGIIRLLESKGYSLTPIKL